ncbi:MAG: PAS domain S-box protein, partial [Caldilineaceae bacterium]|nr:PAS domain S-box protein [Caldilineaceae bacterium]
RDISDRRNAELQIAQGAQHLRNVLNSVAAFVGVVTPDGILLQANRTSLQAANLKHADVIGKHFADTYWWSYDESVQEQLRNAIARAATGEVIRYDVKVRVGAERYIIIDFMLAPIVDEHGQVTHLIPSGVDVTERRLMESALRQSEERLRLATDAGNIGIFDHDLRQDRVEYTDIYLAITGLNDLRSPTRADRWGRVHPEDWPLLEEKIQRAEERGESYDMEYRIFHPDGSLHWMVVSALVITDAEGRGVRVTGAVRDITNRKQAEETIRHSEERFRSTFEQAAVGMAHTDQNGYYVQVNERLCEIVGYTRAELLQKRFIELVHPDERARNSALNEQLIAGELPSYAVEKRYIRRDGSFVWVHVTASSVYDELREVSYRLAVIEDISARKAAEAALQELNATLEQRIRSRTAELERSNRELDQFAYVASHDLRAPLRAINHLANWIVEDANEVLPPASQQHLATLRGRIQRMEKLLEDLLTYSRVGRRPTTVEPVDSGDLVAQIVEMLNPPPGFSVTAVGKLPTFSTRRVPLELVLRNLIQNAIKHHDRADGHVNVSVREEAEWVEFAVQDDGPGIAPAFHERIFHIFQTLQPRDEVEGSGMGLAVVKKVVESIGGAISVDSLEGQGATFRFTWPK